MPIRVLAAVIEQNEKFLVCQRPPHKRHGGLWEFPGGKMEPGETELEAAARELDEELGVSVLGVERVQFSIADAGSDFIIDFVPVAIQGVPEPREHSELRWLRLTELPSLALAPSDRRFVESLIASANE